MFRRYLALVVLILAAAPVRALEPDQLLLIVNGNVGDGVQLAHYYAQARHVPRDRIVSVDLPPEEEISFDLYQRNVVDVVRDYLRRHALDRKVTCLVTFYGMPLRVQPRVNTAADEADKAAIEAELEAMPGRTAEVVGALEEFVAERDRHFASRGGTDMLSLARRANVGTRRLAELLKQAPAGPERAAFSEEAQRLVRPILGAGRAFPGDAAPADDGLTKLRTRVVALRGRSYDAAARAQLRRLVAENLSPFEYWDLLLAQKTWLQTDNTCSALDSELALLWDDLYAHVSWQGNPLHDTGVASANDPGAVMVMRLDAPRAVTVRDMIDESIRVEEHGLRGKVVIDARGLSAVKSDGVGDPYGIFDQTLGDLAQIVRTKTDLPLVFDDQPGLLGPHAAHDVAVYCGWYSLRNYVPCCDFTAGAVGYHIASLELVSLHVPKERGWCAGLLNDGVAATLGAVAEPYLQAFPPPNQFFPLLFTGKLTLAEVYWKTTPMTSWMIAMIGDPLYNPFKHHPALRVEDLAPNLRECVPAAVASTTQRSGP